MTNIRILIRDAPTMLRDILEQAISSQPDMVVIREPAAPDPHPSGALPPDVVVVSVSDSDPGAGARELLSRWPGSRALVIAAHGHQVFKYDLQPRRVDLGEMSPEQLLQAIRAATRPERKSHAH